MTDHTADDGHQPGTPGQPPDETSGNGRDSRAEAPSPPADESATIRLPEGHEVEERESAAITASRDVFYDDELSGKAYDWRLMRRLLRYLKPHKGLLAATITLTLLLAVVEVWWPWLLGEFIDGPFKQYLSGRDSAAAQSAFAWFVGVFSLYLVAQFFARWLHVYLTSAIGQHTIYDLRCELFAHLQKLHLGWYDRNPVGRLVTRVTSDIEALSEMFSSGVIALVADLLRILCILVVMFIIDWQLSLVVMAVTPIVIAVSWVFGNRMRRAFREMRKRLAAVNAALQESISGMSLIQAFRQEEKAAAALDRRNYAHYEATLNTIFNFALFAPIVGLFTNIALAGLLFVGGIKLVAAAGGDPVAIGFTMGVFTTFYFWTRKLFEPIRELSEKYNILQAAMASSERIFRILDTPPAVADPHPSRAVPADAPVTGEVELERVSFWYRKNEWVLRDVSLKIPAGQRVALVGATGSGKSTITNLVPRFYDVQKGAVRIDGRDVRDYDVEALRRHIGFVLQDVFLFSGSVRDNIRLGERERIDDNRVKQVARELGASAFIEALPDGYEQDVHERGLTLSTGQRQLLAFARALAFDPKILILDEATANIDTESEALVQAALDTLCKGRTAIIVAHRLSTIRNSDQILVIHHGEIRERGTHDELMAKAGIYARLYALQYQAATAN